MKQFNNESREYVKNISNIEFPVVNTNVLYFSVRKLTLLVFYIYYIHILNLF